MEVQRSADLTAMGRTYPQISDEPGVISARVRPVLKKRGLAALSVEDREEPVLRAGAEALTLLLDRRAVDDLTATSEGQGAAAPAAVRGRSRWSLTTVVELLALAQRTE